MGDLAIGKMNILIIPCFPSILPGFSNIDKYCTEKNTQPKDQQVYGTVLWSYILQVFESENSYTITYYDNPLQPGIAPRWSDLEGWWKRAGWY